MEEGRIEPFYPANEVWTGMCEEIDGQSTAAVNLPRWGEARVIHHAQGLPD